MRPEFEVVWHGGSWRETESPRRMAVAPGRTSTITAVLIQHPKEWLRVRDICRLREVSDGGSTAAKTRLILYRAWVAGLVERRRVTGFMRVTYEYRWKA